MLFHYKAIDNTGNRREGDIDAVSLEVAISSLQRRGLVISSVNPADKKSLFFSDITLFEKVTNKDLVILSRQIATLFEAQVSALRVFKLLAAESPNPALRKKLTQVADDLQGGNSIVKALSRHPDVFSDFYVNMVKSGEEAGTLNETFIYLADYLDRTYEVSTKARNALFYPAFVIGTFVVVMVLMLTMVIPKIGDILAETGQEVPIYTKVVLGISDFLVNSGVFVLVALIIIGYLLWRYSKSEEGRHMFSELRMSLPVLGTLYKTLYLSRIADNFSTMLSSGIPMVRAIELTAGVVGNKIYEDILMETSIQVKSGSSISAALGKYEEIPGIMVQMMKVGEETGELGKILETLAKFYRREVNNAVDTLVGLIEPIMIIVLGVGVGVLLASVLIPIYNIAGSF